MKYNEMSKNFVFRELECGLSVEETAKLCFKSVSTVKKWDKGQEIPKECKRLMRMHKRLELSHSDEWQGFKMHKNHLELPTGQSITPQQILAGVGLLHIGSELEIATSTHLLKLARVLSKLKESNN
ncbi:MAG: phage protein [Vibrionaceae bacterium]|nr:phage protein [Vibrionaceae bacterium]